MKFGFVAFAVLASAFSANAFVSRALPSQARRSASSSLTMDVKVVAGEGEAMESLLRRFKREVNKSGHLMELRHRRYFEDSQDLKKRKIKEQRRRLKMEWMQNRKNNRFQNN